MQMLDWLKFFPFAWRDDHKPAEVRGPYFPKLRQNKWFLKDSLIRFSAPISNPIFGFSGRGDSVDERTPGTANLLETEWERVYGRADGAPVNPWDRDIFYSNTWYFVGPWFTGIQARLNTNALLITANERGMFSDKNLFHPRVFETAIANYLDISYGYDKAGRKPRYRGPLNWRVLPLSSSIQAVVCDIHHIGNSSKENPDLQRQIYFPITPQNMIRINFDFGDIDIYRDEVRAKPLFKLCDSIIETFRMEVGKNTQAEWDKVKATCPDMSITDTFGELPWPLTLEKPSKGPKEKDITPSQAALIDQANTKESD